MLLQQTVGLLPAGSGTQQFDSAVLADDGMRVRMRPALGSRDVWVESVGKDDVLRWLNWLRPLKAVKSKRAVAAYVLPLHMDGIFEVRVHCCPWKARAYSLRSRHP